MIPTEPGLYPGLPYDAYAQIDARRASVLKWGAKSAKRMRAAALAVEDKETAATRLGGAAHVALLEPDRFEKLYVPGLNLSRRGAKNATLHARHELEHLGKEVLPADEYDDALRMRDCVWSKPYAQELLGGPGVAELSGVWDDPSSGVRCKMRIDRLVKQYRGLPTVMEFKTFRGEAVKEAWKREITNRAYHLQAFMQLEGLTRTAGEHARRFVWLVIEKGDVIDCALFTPQETEADRAGRLVLRETNALEEGERLFHASTMLWAACERAGHWPGYSVQPQTVDLPPWALSSRNPMPSASAIQKGDDDDDVF